MNKKIRYEAITMLITVGVILFLVIVGAYQDMQASYAYTDTCIYMTKSGDTLWNIAESYKAPNQDIRKVVTLIREINGGISADIDTEQILIIPLFDIIK